MLIEIDKYHSTYIRLDDFDCWDMDQMMAKIIVAMLTQFKGKVVCGVPPDYYHGPESTDQMAFDFIDDQADIDAAVEKYKSDIDEMIWAFDTFTGKTLFARSHNKDRVENGLNLFARNFKYFWL